MKQITHSFFIILGVIFLINGCASNEVPSDQEPSRSAPSSNTSEERQEILQPLERIDQTTASRMKNAYRDNPLLFGKYEKPQYKESDPNVTVYRSGTTIDSVKIIEDRSLHSWRLTSADLNEMVRVNNFSGMRVYPAVDTAGVEIVLINGSPYRHIYQYHTLVYYATTSIDGLEPHDNHNQAYQYAFPCPDNCKSSDARVKSSGAITQ
jgi:hypothetical protein